MDKELVNKVEKYLKDHKNEIVRDLIRLVKIPSVTGAPRPGAPYGENCRRCLDEAVALFRENGFTAEVKADGVYGIASLFDENPKTVCLYGHTDVVPVSDGWVYCDPFDPVIINDTVIGRGAEDNKSGVIASLYVGKMLKELNVPFGSRYQVYLGSNEEVGMDDIEVYKKNEKMPELSLVPDNSFPICAGERGILRFWVNSDNAFTDILTIDGGSAFNIILECVTAKIKYSEKLEKELKGKKNITAEKTGDILTVTATGITSHVAHPDNSLNAMYVLCEALKSSSALCDGDKKILRHCSDMLKTVHGECFGIYAEDTDFGILCIGNGMVKTESGKLSLSFDVRYGSSITGKDIVKNAATAAKEKDFSFSLVSDEPGYNIPDSNPTGMVLGEVYRELSGDKTAKNVRSAGGTYARHLKNAYSMGTTVPYMIAPVDMPEGHGECHQSDESLFIDSYLEAIKIIFMMTVEGEKTI